MQILIDIPEELYKANLRGLEVGELWDLRVAIKNGIPLPKGHGRLIDADELEELFGKKCVGDCGACMTKIKTDGRGRWYDTCSLIDNAPTIIETDTAESEDKE